jgi:hypothetical protein
VSGVRNTGVWWGGDVLGVEPGFEGRGGFMCVAFDVGDARCTHAVSAGVSLGGKDKPFAFSVDFVFGKRDVAQLNIHPQGECHLSKILVRSPL